MQHSWLSLPVLCTVLSSAHSLIGFLFYHSYILHLHLLDISWGTALSKGFAVLFG